MAQSAKLQLRQTQGLALTPQLMQSINLLQMSSLELNTFVQNEIVNNPLLEINEFASEFPEERRAQIINKDSAEVSESRIPLALDGRPNEWNTEASQFHDQSPDAVKTDRKPGSVADQQSSHIAGSGQFEFSGNSNDPTAYVADQQSLRDFLLQQATLSFRTANELHIAQNIIDLIDDDGYLRADLSALCVSLKTNMAVITAILEKIQKFDPPGVGARDLAECLRLQLMEKSRMDPAMEIFTNNLDLLAKRNYEKLAELCKVSHEDLIDMAVEIQNLEPRPGDAFSAMPVQHITADVFVSAHNDGAWQIELNTENLPNVLVNREYYAEIKGLGLKNSDRKYMIDNLQSANWLVASLDQRAQTILKVATEIVRQQDTFFVKGKEFLKPLTLKMIAKETELHESTISRVTRNKYLTCDKGIFEFKYFFMSGVAGKKGDDAFGGESIRAKIQNLIQLETVDRVLSDEDIVNLLSKEGIEIARRTVAKYRDSIGILSSVERRRQLKAFGKSDRL